MRGVEGVTIGVDHLPFKETKSATLSKVQGFAKV